MDFNLEIYKLLLETLLRQGFLFQDINTSLGRISKDRAVHLRQDVDMLSGNSLKVAEIQRELGIRSVFYFRVVKESWDEGVIGKIAELGHKIGYHYEDLSLVAAQRRTTNGKRLREKEVVELGIESFERNLEKLRKLVPVKSICMHGSPMSRWDSRLFWKYYDYKDYGIESEPYFDVSFEDRLYLTDTGRRWNGSSVSVRDRAGSMVHGARGSSSAGASEGEGSANIKFRNPKSELFSDWVRKPITGSLMNMTPKAVEFQSRYNYRHTKDIIRAIETGEFPEKVMMTFHPQRWTNKPVTWLKELIWQNMKNTVKYFLIKMRK